MDLIIKKLAKHFQANPNSLLIGDVRQQLSVDLLKTLTDVIDKKSGHPRPYFILVHTKMDPSIRGGNGIKERIILLDQPPSTRFLGTLLLRIDNKNADAEIIWNLPLDIPALSFLKSERANHRTKPGVAGIRESSIGSPIFNRLPI